MRSTVSEVILLSFLSLFFFLFVTFVDDLRGFFSYDYEGS